MNILHSVTLPPLLENGSALLYFLLSVATNAYDWAEHIWNQEFINEVDADLVIILSFRMLVGSACFGTKEK